MTNVQSAFIFMILMWSHTIISSNSIPSLAAQYQNIQPQLPQGPPPIKPKQNVQQFQIAVVLPPGTQPSQGSQPPNAPSPEYVWLQVPASYFTSQAPPLAPTAEPPQRPAIVQPPRPANPPIVPPTQSPTPDLLLKKCQKPRGQFQSDSCNKYVNCWDGVAVEQFCPEGLVFHPKGYCDYPQNVECGGRPIEGIPPPPTPSEENTSSAPGQASSQAPTTAAPPTVIVTLPTIDPNLRKKCLKPRGQFRSESCNKYVNCWDDVVIEQECPEGLLFSSKGYCDFPYNVDCNSASIPSRSGADVDTECPLDFGTFRQKDNCSNYFTCIGGKVVARYTCPDGFKFNDNIGVCDHEYRVDCSKEPLIFYPKSNFLSNVPKDFITKIDQCKPGTVFRLNSQCTTACICHDNGSEVVQCPNGLAYDTQTDKCISPHLAKC